MLDFLGIGAQKAGTTYLYEMLKKHPRVLFPAGKEIHFWDSKSSLDIDQYRGFFSDDGRELIKGEITPAYAILPYEIIEEIHREYPSVKVIYIIRDPIERAWSHAVMALTVGIGMTLEEASDQWFIDHFRSQGSLLRGDYESCIKTWTSVFPMEQFLVLTFDQLSTDPKQFLLNCLTHIGLDNYAFTDEIYQPVFKGLGVPIRTSLLPILQEIYIHKIYALSSYLNQDFTGWLKKDIS